MTGMFSPITGAVCQLAILAAGTAPPPPPKASDAAVEQFSYSLGAKLGRDLTSAGYTLSIEHLVSGLRDALNGSLRMNDEQITAAIEAFATERKREQERIAAEQIAQAKAASQAFLTENGRRPAVKTLPGGVQYEVLQPGSGTRPNLSSRVTVHYRGKLVDGVVFDDTYLRGKPMTFTVADVVAGWEQALLHMATGARWKIYIPPDLAYGRDGFAPRIPPHAVLILTVELLAAEEAAK